jgi:hypothetical protein
LYVLLQGLILAIESSIQSLMAVGDSNAIIGKMVSNATPIDNLLALVLEQAKKEEHNFTDIKFFQVLWENNQIADAYANQAPF